MPSTSTKKRAFRFRKRAYIATKSGIPIAQGKITERQLLAFPTHPKDGSESISHFANSLMYKHRAHWPVTLSDFG